MRALGSLPLILALLLLFLFPFLFSQLLVASLTKLQISQDSAVALVFAILLGGLVNIPLRRIPHADMVVASPLSVYGLPQRWARFGQAFHETIIAVNLGGCIIPTGIALYELNRLGEAGAWPLQAAGLASVANIALCFSIARPMPGVGIAIPAFAPPLAAALLAMILAPDQAPAVAFVAGVAGPLIGADLLHLRSFARSGPGVASIGGAGTFDGIVLSGVIAAYLA
jgi:uncharacterized membrane protein